MSTLFLMIIAFSIILGVALLYTNLLKLNIGESYVLATVTLIGIIYATGLKYQNLLLGRNLYCLLGLIGIISTGVLVSRRKFSREKLASIYLPALFVLLIMNVILYHNDFIRYIDEFHMWAAAPKYMLQHNRLPIYDDFAGVDSKNIGTCIFHYFFQSFTGNNEGAVYASGSLLSCR